MHSERLKSQIEDLKEELYNMRLDRSRIINDTMIRQNSLDVIKVQVNAFEKLKQEVMIEIEEKREDKYSLECEIKQLRFLAVGQGALSFFLLLGLLLRKETYPKEYHFWVCKHADHGDMLLYPF